MGTEGGRDRVMVLWFGDSGRGAHEGPESHGFGLVYYCAFVCGDGIVKY